MAKRRPKSQAKSPAELDVSRAVPTSVSRGRRRWGFIVLACALGVSMVVAGLWWSRAPSAPAAVLAGYADSRECAQCHQEIAATYSRTGMGRSIYRPTSSNAVEDYHQKNQFHHAASNSYYTMEERGGQFFQRRHQLGFDGKVSNVAELQVDYVIGSGDHARSYLHRTSEGRLIELPVSWYTEKGGSWQMSPGYDNAGQKDFHGSITYDCMFCHNGYPTQATSKQIAESGEPIFPPEIPTGIDCQRCHGPGAAHIKAAKAKKPEEDVRKSIVNPATLPRERQIEVCMECHLSTSASQGSNVSLRFNRDVYSYVPGQPLGDYKLYFDYTDVPGRNDGFEIADAAYRLRISSCFRNSQMTCLTCHDPHEDAHGSKAEAHYLETCQSCHKTVMHKVALPQTETCISCHMPKRRGEYATHVVLTDHYIQRQRPLRDLLAPLQEASGVKPETALALFYPQKLTPSPENDLYLAIAKAESDKNPTKAIAELRDLLERTKPKEAGFYDSLGNAYFRQGDFTSAIYWLKQALVRSPRLHTTIEKISEAYLATGQGDEARQLLEAEAQQPPADSVLLANLGIVYARIGRLDDAERTLHQALELNPDLAPANQLLGQLALRKGDRASAERLFREAIRNQPGLVEAHLNLAEVLAGEERAAEAEFEVKRALEIAPQNADAHHSYGMMLVLARRRGEAEQELRRALELNSRDAQTHSDLADVLAASGRMGEAEREYRTALSLDGSLADAQAGLAHLSP